MLILFFFLCMALFSAGCTSTPVNQEPTVTTPAETIAMAAAENRATQDDNTGLFKNAEANESMIGTPPKADAACGMPGGNQSVCPVPAVAGTQIPLSVTQMPDPATAYCMAMNNSLEIRKNPDGSEYTFCILPDGTSCEVWDYYNGVCPLLTTVEVEAPDQAAETPLPDLAAAYCTDMGNLFEFRKNPDGSDAGVCILWDGTECDALAYYDGTCPVAPVLEETPVDATVIVEYEALCRAKNFPYEIKTRPDGSVHGVCTFPNGRECDAQDYYVGDCIDEMALEES